MKLYGGGGISTLFLDVVFFVGYVMMLSVMRYYSIE
jgi:hypothetical protein